MRLSWMLVVASSLALAAPLSAQEAVSTSRYRMTLGLPEPGTVWLPLDQTPFEDRCSDEDGCEITLVMDGASPGAVHGRMFLLAHDLWVTLGGVIQESSDGNVDTAAAVSGTFAACELLDADSDAGLDSTPAFSLKVVVSSFLATCVLTVID